MEAGNMVNGAYCISTTCPACGNGFIATDETPEMAVRERDERMAMERVIEAARARTCCDDCCAGENEAICGALAALDKTRRGS